MSAKLPKKKIKQFFYPSHGIITLIAFTIVAVLLFSFLNIQFLNPLKLAFKDFRLSDLYYQLYDDSSLPESNEFFVVDVAELKNRESIAKVISEVDNAGAKVIALDILFGNDDRHLENMALVEALDSTRATIVAGMEMLDDELDVVSSFFVNDKIIQGYMNTNIIHNYETLRSYTFEYVNQVTGDTLSSFPYAISQAYGIEKRREIDQAAHNIDFTEVRIPVINFRDIAQYKDRLKDGVVIIGLATGGEDQFITPIGKVSGPQCVALAVNSIINGREIRDLPQWVSILVALVFTYLFVVWLSWIHFKLPFAKPVLIMVSVLASSFVLQFLNMVIMYLFGVSIELVYSILGLSFSSSAMAIYITILFLLNNKGIVKSAGNIYLQKK